MNILFLHRLNSRVIAQTQTKDYKPSVTPKIEGLYSYGDGTQAERDEKIGDATAAEGGSSAGRVAVPTGWTTLVNLMVPQ